MSIEKPIKPERQINPEDVEKIRGPEEGIENLTPEGLEAHVGVIKDVVRETSENFTVSAEEIVSKAAQNMGVRPEELEKAEKEFGLNEKLKEVEKEAKNVAHETLRQIEEIMDSDEQTGNAETSESLANSLHEDPRYKEILEELRRKHMEQLFGTTDIKSVPLEIFAKKLNSPQHLKFVGEVHNLAEKEFRRRYPKIARKYDEMKRTRIYYDANGVPDIWLDPAFLELREPDERGVTKDPWEAFARLYPEKARIYAKRYKQLERYITVFENKPPQIEDKPQTIEDESKTNHTAEDEKTLRKIEVTSEQEIIDGIIQQIEEIRKKGVIFDENYFENRRNALLQEQVLDTNYFNLVAARLDERGFYWVPVDRIVGRPFASKNPNGWAHEYKGREGRIIEIAKEILRIQEESSEGNIKYVEEVFHFRQPSARIKAIEIQGPAGSFYIVEDGNHRVAGAKLLGLKEIPCQVKEIKYPLEITFTQEEENIVLDWGKKMELGIIEGNIKEEEINGRKLYRIKIERELLPWLRITNPFLISVISKVYEALFPGSLDNLPIPKEALLDPKAYEYYINGRWEEWLDLKKRENT
jgi:RNase P/RNase MRP subunit p29